MEVRRRPAEFKLHGRTAVQCLVVRIGRSWSAESLDSLTYVERRWAERWIKGGEAIERGIDQAHRTMTAGGGR